MRSKENQRLPVSHRIWAKTQLNSISQFNLFIGHFPNRALQNFPLTVHSDAKGNFKTARGNGSTHGSLCCRLPVGLPAHFLGDGEREPDRHGKEIVDTVRLVEKKVTEMYEENSAGVNCARLRARRIRLVFFVPLLSPWRRRACK